MVTSIISIKEARKLLSGKLNIQLSDDKLHALIIELECLADIILPLLSD